MDPFLTLISRLVGFTLSNKNPVGNSFLQLKNIINRIVLVLVGRGNCVQMQQTYGVR